MRGGAVSPTVECGTFDDLGLFDIFYTNNLPLLLNR